MNTLIQLPGLTIDISALRSVFADDGYSPQWSGKVVLKFAEDLFDDGNIVENTITANWSGKENSREGKLCDFEGEDEILAEGCALHDSDAGWSEEISKRLSLPSYWDAHANDLADPTFAARHEPMKAA